MVFRVASGGGSSGLVIGAGATPIIGGTANRILFEDGTGTLAQSANLGYSDTLVNGGPGIVLGSGTTTSVGMQFGYSGISGYGAMFGTGVTPSTSNYYLLAFQNGSLLALNSSQTLSLQTGGVTRFTIGANSGTVTVEPAIATPANGSTTARLQFGSTAGFGIYYGSSTPSVSAGKGSLYLRSDGTTTNDRAYINTDGGTTWTALTTAA